jgi:hypothetical protein
MTKKGRKRKTISPLKNNYTKKKSPVKKNQNQNQKNLKK